MADVMQFDIKPHRNLFIVDDYHVVLSYTAEDALRFVQYEEDSDKEMDIRIVDDQKELNVIRSGKVEVILWEREPKPLEQLSFKIKVREFIEQYLKRFPVPSFQDVVEDRYATRPKK